MKRYIAALFILFFLLFSSPVFAHEIERVEGIAVITTENLNVRSGPSKDYDKLGTLKKDTMVRVVGFVEPDWYVIEYGGVEGFIHKDYILFTQEEVDETKDTSNLIIIVIVSSIIVVVISMAVTLLKNGKYEEDEEVDSDVESEHIPLVSHEDTNMHLGEVSYDTYRLDIDPIYFEHTTMIPQPESIYDIYKYEENSESKEDYLKGEKDRIAGEKKEILIQEEYHSLDMKLEEATAQIAALQKEVEELKKNKV